MNKIRLAYILSSNSSLHKTKVFFKYFLMKRMGFIYPDAYCVPYYLSGSYKIFGIGDNFDAQKIDYLFTELYAYEEQLEYLDNISRRFPQKLIVILGPPYVFNKKTSQQGYEFIKSILKNSKVVLAYSSLIKKHFLELVPESNIKIFNWPFDLNTIKKIIKGKNSLPKKAIDISINTPLRFNDCHGMPAEDIKKILTELMNSLEDNIKSKLMFHSFVYTKEDLKIFNETRFADGFPLKLHSKMSFKNFVLFMNNCDAVINYNNPFILGRITLISGALNKPGLFNISEINNRIYPKGTTEIDDLNKIIARAKKLVEALASDGDDLVNFLPDYNEIGQYGNITRSAQLFEKIIVSN